MRAMRVKRVLFLAALAGCSSAVKKAPPDLAPVVQTAVVFDNVRISSQSSAPSFQHATADIDFGTGPFSKVVLIADLTSTCFPFDKWQSDPPPMGQNWPADCDAFDRNYEFTLDEPAAQGMSEPPAIELSRAITPFGGPEHLEIDITDVANGKPGAHKLTVTIPTWSDGAGQVSGSNGGWNVSARLEATLGAAPRKVLAVVPLWNLSHGSTTTPPVGAFTTPDGTVSTRLEYRATGHGGANGDRPACIGPAEEFCRRVHHLLLDGAEVEAGLAPFRKDCDQNCTVMRYDWPSGRSTNYCFENPCGDMNSVTAPRANWCPGTPTPPLTWDPPAAHTPGAHQLTYTIDGVASGGSWRLSAVFFAFGN
jgi:hypothetical protein